jgi:hypothetical protein
MILLCVRNLLEGDFSAYGSSAYGSSAYGSQKYIMRKKTLTAFGLRYILHMN